MTLTFDLHLDEPACLISRSADWSYRTQTHPTKYHCSGR